MSDPEDFNRELILQNHFRWWDDYIADWLQGQYPWHRYLPEPWWGWTPESGMELKSISLNLSPGLGGDLQLRDAMSRVLYATTYSDAMRKGLLAKHLPETEEWHRSNRAEKLLGKDASDVKNHLSIELSPLHARNSAFLEDYLDLYFEEVVNHSLTFAADAARYAQRFGKNISVFIRCSPQRFYNFFKRPGNSNSLNLNKEPVVRFSFKDSRLMEVDFLCFKGSRNQFPKNVADYSDNKNNQEIPEISI